MIVVSGDDEEEEEMEMYDAEGELNGGAGDVGFPAPNGGRWFTADDVSVCV